MTLRRVALGGQGGQSKRPCLLDFLLLSTLATLF